MNEKFESILINQYKEDIEEIIMECEHVYRSTIDYELMFIKVEELICSAKVDGLSEKIIWELLQTRIPAFVNYMNYKSASGKKIA